MKLYEIITRFNPPITGSHIDYKTCFVIAPDAESAYQKYKTFLDSESIGFRHERELDSIKLLAERSNSPDCKRMLFLS